MSPCNVAQGFRSFFSGISFLIARPRLWWLAIIPACIGLIMLIIMFAGFFHYYGDLHAWIISHIGHLHLDNPDVWWMHVLNALLWVVDLIVQLLAVLISVILIVLVFYIATLIVSAPFNDMLSERVEEEVTGIKAPPFSIEADDQGDGSYDVDRGAQRVGIHQRARHIACTSDHPRHWRNLLSRGYDRVRHVGSGIYLCRLSHG